MKKIYLYWIFGLFALLGRYDFNGNVHDYALRSFVLSALLFTALIFFAGLQLNFHWPLVLITLIFCLPYHLLTLDQYFYHLKTPLLHHWQNSAYPLPQLDWFPGAWDRLPAIPNELPFFIGLTSVLVVLYYFFSKKFALDKTKLKLGIFCLLMLSLQTWLHLSMRSPYTYVPHFEGPAQDNYWFHYYLFPNQKGAVNLDYLAFRVGEELFFGHQGLSNPLLTRAFPTYLASQFTALFNPIYVWLSLNIFFWFMAVIGIYLIAKHFFDEKTALFSGALMASNQSLILYVGQPKVYAIAICLLVLVLVAQLKLLKQLNWRSPNLYVFSLLLFFFLLSYEAQPWILGLIAFAYVSKLNLRITIYALLLGILSYYGFLKIASFLPALKLSITLAGNAGDPAQNIINLLLSGNLWKLFIKILMSMRGFGRSLAHCFQLCIIPAIYGLWVIKKNQRPVIFSLLLAPFLTYAFFEIGDNWLYTRFPRLVMLAYPAIFLLAGIGLSKLYLKNRFIAWAFIVGNFLYLNMDVWGHPWIYYLWFYKNPGYSWVY